MLKKRLIACLLWRDGMLVQSKGFKHTNSVGRAYTAIDFFNTWSIDEIVLLDVTREPTKREQFHSDLTDLSSRCFVPLAVGGWVDTVEEMRRLLSEGADKVVINSGAFRNEQFIREGAERFGKQCLVLSIDAKRTSVTPFDTRRSVMLSSPSRGEGVSKHASTSSAQASGATQGDTVTHEVFIDRGRKGTGVSPVAWAKQAEEWGVGEIFLTSIDQDGTGNGYDLSLISSVAGAVDVPVIASGGVGNWQHCIDALEKGHADAVSAANIFHYLEQSTKKAKNELFAHGINIRHPEFYDIGLPRNPLYRVE